MDNDTGTDLDISVPIKVGAENSTCRTTNHYHNIHINKWFIDQLPVVSMIVTSASLGLPLAIPSVEIG